LIGSEEASEQNKQILQELPAIKERRVLVEPPRMLKSMHPNRLIKFQAEADARHCAHE
jgi:hypothetical protein